MPTETSGPGPLNLADADTRGFEAIPAARYNAEVFAMTLDAVKNTNGRGKTPAGTLMIKVQFKITDEPYNNRRVFVTYVIPPKDYEESKAQKMKGMIVNLFTALGVPEETVRSNKFNPEYDEFVGRECVVVVGREPKKDMEGAVIDGEFNNPVKGVKPAGTLAGATSGSGLL